MRPSLSTPTHLSILILSLSLAGCAEPAPAPAPAAEPEQPVVADSPIDPASLLPNAAEPLAGVITGGQPTLEQLDAASAAGVKTVINLRTEGETDIGQADVESRGMAYVGLPIAPDDLSRENAVAFGAAVDAAERPAIVHCGSSNRVGALFALRAFYEQGADVESAIEIGRAAGLTRMEGAVREHLAEASRPE